MKIQIALILIAMLFSACSSNNRTKERTYEKHGITWPIDVGGEKIHYNEVKMKMLEKRDLRLKGWK